jgi:hypothetical protein
LGFFKRVRPLMVALLAASVAACAGGQGPQPTTFQSEDESLDCPAIFAEISSNKRRIEELGGEGTEAKALQDRQSYIATLATQRHCGGGQPPPTPPTPNKRI